MSFDNEKRSDYLKKKKEILQPQNFVDDALDASFRYSVLTEEFIVSIIGERAGTFAVASSGSFSRRELSPHSDIDLIFIVKDMEKSEDVIKQIVADIWDHGIDLSHTVRELKDIDYFIERDLHTFTQFFETRFLTGSINIYSEWNDTVLKSLSYETKQRLFDAFIADTDRRYDKYGNSPKIIEPNVKITCGGLRDFQLLEWIYILTSNKFLNTDIELTQAEIFIDIIREKKFTGPRESERLLKSYRYLMMIRNLMHSFSNQPRDRLEFNDQVMLAEYLKLGEEGYRTLMRNYFEATGVIYRFSKSYIKRNRKALSVGIPDSLAIELDQDYIIKGDMIFTANAGDLNMSDIMRGFYYRGLYSAHFDEALRNKIINSIDGTEDSSAQDSSVFFREIMCLPKNVGLTLSSMNELGVLGAFMPEFNELNGFIQHGVYHCYTADEHTIKTIINVEALEDDTSLLGNIYNTVINKELLFLALLFHDIAKPLDIIGHEIMGAEIADSILQRLGFSDTAIELAKFLIRNHLLMTQFAFHRNLNDAQTLNTFVSQIGRSREKLDMLYLLTYADLSAVNPALWTSWKRDLLSELYSKAKRILDDKISAKELLHSETPQQPDRITRHSDSISNDLVEDHFSAMDDTGYVTHFTEPEIARHVEEIASGLTISVMFKELDDFTNITVITKDTPSLLSKLCGVLTINDVNIHDAKIFTRRDGIVIDNFNVTDFRSGKKIVSSRYEKIQEDFKLIVADMLPIAAEMNKMKTRWWRIENKLFRRQGTVDVKFEEMQNFTIIDIFSPDRLGFLYHVTGKFHDMGLNIYFAKINTSGDEVVDSFYVLDKDKRKISKNFYPVIRTELIETINEIL